LFCFVDDDAVAGVADAGSEADLIAVVHTDAPALGSLTVEMTEIAVDAEAVLVLLEAVYADVVVAAALVLVLHGGQGPEVHKGNAGVALVAAMTSGPAAASAWLTGDCVAS